MPQLEVGPAGGTLGNTGTGTGIGVRSGTGTGTRTRTRIKRGTDPGSPLNAAHRLSRLPVPRGTLCGLPLVHALPTAGRGRPRRR
ncbi:hypothetical protein AB0O01_22445 [Streptomyces sp. NPDC093252]|uniref:hypothetical protein n=1 Tax=Streptomyces sp. NPDC093252 TaxID=3154980 RepID=UPI003422F5F5